MQTILYPQRQRRAISGILFFQSIEYQRILSRSSLLPEMIFRFHHDGQGYRAPRSTRCISFCFSRGSKILSLPMLVAVEIIGERHAVRARRRANQSPGCSPRSAYLLFPKKREVDWPAAGIHAYFPRLLRVENHTSRRAGRARGPRSADLGARAAAERRGSGGRMETRRLPCP